MLSPISASAVVQTLQFYRNVSPYDAEAFYRRSISQEAFFFHIVMANLI